MDNATPLLRPMMHIRIIRSFEEFLLLKENWNCVYEADPDATFFYHSLGFQVG